jgi:hypothetical protein
LVACEYSGIVRDAFAARGWDAWSCDLRETERPGQHVVGDVRQLLKLQWDLLIAHPPCTYLANSGAKHLYVGKTKAEKIALGYLRDEERWTLMREGAAFFNLFTQTDIPHVAIENPVMHGHAQKLVGGTATQYVQPFHFGVKESKQTGLRLQNLPLLQITDDVETEMRKLPKRVWNRIHFMSPGPERERERSRTFPAIAQAMADQWGPYIENLIAQEDQLQEQAA